MLWRSTHLGRARSRRDFHIDGSVVDQWIGLLGSSLSRLMSRLGTRATAGFPAFHYRDLRVLGLGSALGSFGQFGEVIALGWLVLANGLALHGRSRIQPAGAAQLVRYPGGRSGGLGR